MKRATITHMRDPTLVNHGGCKVKEFVVDAAFVQRGYFNVKLAPRDILCTYEQIPCFNKVKSKIIETGRNIPCDCTSECELRKMQLNLTGLTLNLIFDLQAQEIHLPLEQAIGRLWTRYFVKEYMLNNTTTEDHFLLQKDKLPKFVNLSGNGVKHIFRQNTIPRAMIYRS